MQNQTFAHAIGEAESFIAVMYAGQGVTGKVAYYCTSFGLKNGVCHCAEQQWLEIAFVEFSASFVLM